MQKRGNCMVEEYVCKTIGLRYNTKDIARNLVKGLPEYLKGAFDFSLVEIEGQDFLLLTPSTEVDLSTLRIVKYANQITKLTGKSTLIQFNSLDNIRRRTLINHRGNFVVPNKQIYIPSLCMYLNESGSIQQMVAKEKISPSTQLLLLYHLQKDSLEDLPFMEVAERLNYSKKTISIVVAELQRLSVCEVIQTKNRNKVLRFNKNGRDLWDEVKLRMTDPVQKIWYIEKEHLPANLPLYISYDSALAHYSFIADSSLSSFAIDKKDFFEIQKKIQDFLHPEEGDIRLEIWKYDPAMLVDQQCVDRLSLTLCYQDDDDERVRKEIRKIIDDMIW
jgi:DNA-binding MarR family transcriptional regulator